MVYLSPWERHWTIFHKTLSERGYALPQRYNVAGGSTSCLDSRIDLDPATTEHLYRYMVSSLGAHTALPLIKMHPEGGPQTHDRSNTAQRQPSGHD